MTNRNQQQETSKTHKQMCQKIVQLTRVIHRLNVLQQQRQHDDNQDQQNQNEIHRQELALVSKDAEDRIHHIHSNLASAHHQLQQIKREHQTTCQQLTHEKKKNASLCGTFNKKSQEMQKVQREYEYKIQEMIADYAKLQREAHNLVPQIDQHQQNLKEQHDTKIQALESKCASYQEMLQASRTSHKRAQDQWEEKHAALVEIHREYAVDLKVQMEANADLQKEHERKLMSQKEEYENKRREEKEASDGKIKGLEEEISLYKEDSDGKIRVLLSDLDMKQQELNSTKKLFHSQTEELTKAKISLSEIQDRAPKQEAHLKGQVERVRNELREVTNTLVNRDREVQTCKQQNTLLQEEADSSKRHIRSLSSMLRDTKEECRVLSNDLSLALQSKADTTQQYELQFITIKQEMNDRSDRVSTCLKECHLVIVGIKQQWAELKRDCGGFMAREWMRILFTEMKDVLFTKFVDRSNRVRQKIGRLQTENEKELQILRYKHSNAIHCIQDENRTREHRREQEHESNLASLRTTAVTSLKNEIIEIQKKASRDLQESKLHSHNIQKLWEKTLELQQLQHSKNIEHIVIGCDTKWKHRIRNIQELHDRDCHDIVHKMQQDGEDKRAMQLEALCDVYDQALMDGMGRAINIMKSIQCSHGCDYESLQEKRLESELEGLQSKLNGKHRIEMQALESKLANAVERERKALLSEQEQSGNIQIMTKKMKELVDNNSAFRQRCDSLHSKSACAQTEMAKVTENHRLELGAIRSLHLKEIQSLEDKRRSDHEEIKASWSTDRADLEANLTRVREQNMNYSQSNLELQQSTKRQHKELSDMDLVHKAETLRLQTLVENLKQETRSKEYKAGNMLQKLRTCYEDKVDIIRKDLELAQHALASSKAVIQSLQDRPMDRFPSDVEKIKLLEHDLAKTSREKEIAVNDMAYYKTELQNREENFNSRFTMDTRSQSIGVLSTFTKRPSTSASSRRLGKENTGTKNRAKQLRKGTRSRRPSTFA